MKTTEKNYTPIQLKLPVDLERIIKINDPVYSFSEVVAHIDLYKYFVEKEHEIGRPRYDREKLLKIVLFAFMEFGYCSVRQIQKLCETDIRFLWLLDGEKAPSHMTISNFIHNELKGTIEEIFNDINRYMFGQLLQKVMNMKNPMQKKLSFATLEILRQYTDAEHTLNQNDIVEILKKEYDIRADRKSVKRNLTSLWEMGFPIDFKETPRMYPNKDGIMEESFIQHDFYIDREFTDLRLKKRISKG